MRSISTIMIVFGMFAYAGCNVFEGLYDEGGSDDPVVLVADADAAIQRGEPAKAVEYLEKALEKEPENPKVRTKLSTALLQANNIDVISMISLAEEISGNGKNGAASKSTVQACNFTGIAVEEIVLSQNPAYNKIAQHVAVLRRVKDLLDQVVKNAANLNQLSDREKNEARLNQAISTVLVVLYEVEQKSVQLGATLWQLQNKDVGLCANDTFALDAIQQFVKCDKIPEMQEALELLEQRLGSGKDDSQAKEAINEIQKSIDQLRAQIQVSCQ